MLIAAAGRFIYHTAEKAVPAMPIPGSAPAAVKRYLPEAGISARH
jgi:hypothetical protein